MTPARASKLRALRARMALTEGSALRRGVLPIGDGRVDACFPAGGLPLGRWHEFLGEGLEAETGASAAAFAAVLAARLAKAGEVVWVLQHPDLHAPGAAGLGIEPARLLFVHARDDLEALAAAEDALREKGVAAVVGEVDRLDLVAGRRLQLACEGGATGFVLRRRVFGRRKGREADGSAAATRWRVAPAPSEPEFGEPGLGAPRWRVTLERCQGGRTGAWIMEANDEAGPVRVVAELADHEPATARPLRRAVG